MKLTHYLYIVPLALLAACSSEKLEQSQPTTDHPDGPIQLTAGIVEGGSQAATRAVAEDNHDSHKTLTTGTKLALQVSGKWKKTADGTAEDIVRTTTGTVGDETATDSKHNAVTCAPILYWDDYGTADPNNAETGRAEGLTIYGAAINGNTTTAPTVLDWTALTWTLTADQTSAGNTPADKDLLISNNVQPSPGASTSNDGTYKFDERSYGKLLEFRHALSKITVNLKVGTGISAEAFANTVVKLTSNTTTEWAYTTGTVNVTGGIVSNQGGLSAITMYRLSTPTDGYNVTTEALVIPGSQFGGKSGDAYPTIVSINVKGNIYYVTSEMIRKAIDSASYTNSTAFLTKAGKNYIINVTISQTGINITATVTDWVKVIADDVSPVINISGDFGSTSGSAMDNPFSFYRSKSLNDGYGTISGSYYAQDSEASKSDANWSLNPVLFWPDHNTHYQFRGVLPKTSTDGSNTTSPHVEKATHEGAEYQVIKVQNVAYDENSFPSNLMIARPEIDPDMDCLNTETGHTKTKLYDGGICATEGKINLAFRYMMSKVEVNLSTTDGDDKVNLANAKVEITNVYNAGDVKLGDRLTKGTGGKDSYGLNTVAGSDNKRLSAIVPQELTWTAAQASTNVQFRITIYKEGSNTEIDDIYYADVKTIPVKVEGSNDTAAPVNAWESGYHYVYNLKLTKTKVQVTATLANWTKVTASEEVWF